jgi:hypothetical protein
MDLEEEVVVVVVIAEVIAAEGPVAVPISAEGTVENNNLTFFFLLLNFNQIDYYISNFIYIYRSCLFKSKPIAFTGFFHLIYYPTTPSIQP